MKFGEILLKVESDSWKLLDGLIHLVILCNKQFSHDFSLPSTVFPHICAQLVESCSKIKTTLLSHCAWILAGHACQVWSSSLEPEAHLIMPSKSYLYPGFHVPCRQSKYQRRGQIITVMGDSNPDQFHWTTNINWKRLCFLFGYFSL